MKSKNKKFTLLASVFLLVTIAIGIVCVNTILANEDYDFSNVDPMTLRVSTALPNTHGQWVGFHKPLMEVVTEISEGKVKFDTFTAGELVEGGKEYEGLTGGIIDIAAPLMPIYQPTYFPASAFPMLPLGHSDALIGSKAWEAMLKSDVEVLPGKTYVEYEFYDRGIYPMAVNVAAEAVMATTGKEFTSVEAMRGLRMRSGSSVHTMFYKKVGFNPISMPIFDMYDAMSRGALDGSSQFIADWPAYGFEDLYRYCITGVNLGHFVSVWAMDLDKWNSLPEELKKLFQEKGSELIVSGSELFLDWKEDVIKENTEAGTKFVDISELPQDVQDKINTAVAETWADWIAETELKGEPAKAICKLWKDCIVEAGGTVPDTVNELFD